MMSDWLRTLPQASLIGGAFMILVVAVWAGIKIMSKKPPNKPPVKQPPPHEPEPPENAPAAPPDNDQHPKVSYRAFVLPVSFAILLLVAIGGVVVELTRWKLGDPAWGLAGLMVIVAVLFGAYVFATTAWLFTRANAHTSVAGPPVDVVSKEAYQHLERRVDQLAIWLGDESAPNELSIVSRLKLLEESGPGFADALTAITNLKKDTEQLETRFAPAGLKPELDKIVRRMTELTDLTTSVNRLQEQVNKSSAFIDDLRGREFVQNLILDRTPAPSELAAKVRWRYQLLRKNEKYRLTLTAWAESDALRLALRHIRDLRVISVDLLNRAPASLTQTRRKHWQALNQTAHERFEAMTLFFDRLQRMKGARDESEGTMREMLLGLRSLEEECAWSMVPGSRREDAAVPPLYDTAGVDRALGDSARKILELVVTPLVLLFQELFEAREVEESLSAAAQVEYEMGVGVFADDRSSRGSVAAAINSAAAQLGYQYHPIRLFSTTTSESGMLLNPGAQTHVTWKEWYGREDARRGVIVRVKRPAFTLSNDPGALLQEGALVMIGGPGNAGRD